MITFPGGTSIGRVLPKEAFYKQLNLSSELKDKFVSDIRRLVVENSLTAATLHLNPGLNVVEILVLALDLKAQSVDDRILENIARQNKHHLLFWLRFEHSGQLALYFNKLYKTAWQPNAEMQLKLTGFTLDEIWDGFVEQIALEGSSNSTVIEASMAFRLKRQEDIRRLRKRIEQLESAARSEKQPKKKFELAMQIQQLTRELDEI